MTFEDWVKHGRGIGGMEREIAKTAWEASALITREKRAKVAERGGVEDFKNRQGDCRRHTAR